MKSPTTVRCERCGREVPVAPHYVRVSVAHVRAAPRLIEGQAARAVEPCSGNEKRVMRDDLDHPATVLARQHSVLATDAYWEGL